MLSAEAHAKINLTLDIVGKRADGYHTIRSVLQSITLCDRLSLRAGRDGEISVACDRPGVPDGEENTVRRAAKAFFAETGIENPGVSFALEKRIPWQAGLGGGSTDAAAALRLLNEALGAGLGEAELCRIGLSVGADVPFCLIGGTALAEGIGETLTRLPPFPACPVVVCKPAAGSCTREAFEALDRLSCGPTDFTGPMLHALKGGELIRIAACAGNAFEQAIRLPEVGDIRRRMLAAGAAAASMTGSGSAVFGLFGDEEKARRCFSALSENYRDVFLCGPCRPDGRSE